MSRDQAAAIVAEAGLPASGPDAGIRDLPDFDLGELARRGPQPPQLLCGSMLYRGGVHCIAGQPGGGKTTLMCSWLLQHIRDGGRVIFLDEESGEDLLAEKFLDLGASPEELSPPRLNYVPFPARRWHAGDVEQLHERITKRETDIVAWDSAAAVLTIAGRDENSALDVTAFWQHVLVPSARQLGQAVIVTDHTGKGDHGGYGRGSGAKKAASDVQFIVETIRPFNRHQDGVLRLTTSPGKDRRGHLAVAYEIRVMAGPPLTLEIAEGAARAPAGEQPMPPARAKLLEALEAIACGSPVTAGELVDWIAAKHGHGLKRPTVSTNLNELARAGRADFIDRGSGRERLWSAVMPDADTSARTGAAGWPAGSMGDEANL